MAALSAWAFSWSALIWMISITNSKGKSSPTIQGRGLFVVGQNKSLICSIVVPKSEKNSTLRWSVDGGDTPGSVQPLPPREKGNLSTLTTKLTFTVKLTDNMRRFYCVAVLNSGPVNSSWTVYITRAPTQPVLSGPSTVKGGTNGTWTCVVDGTIGQTPIVSWLFGNKTRVSDSLFSSREKLYAGASQTEIINVTSTLTMPVAIEDQSFNLTCRAVHSASRYTGQSSISVTVGYLPRITVQDALNGTELQSITLPCTVDAKPEVTSITWYKDGQVLNTVDTGRYSRATPGSPSLTILSVRLEDGGTYNCRASNSLGSTISNTTTLTIQRKTSVSAGQGRKQSMLLKILGVVLILISVIGLAVLLYLRKWKSTKEQEDMRKGGNASTRRWSRTATPDPESTSAANFGEETETTVTESDVDGETSTVTESDVEEETSTVMESDVEEETLTVMESDVE